MKVIPDITPIDFGASLANQIILPQGIIGFSQYQRAELLYMPDHLPFLWMRLHGKDAADTIHFIVMEPGGRMTLNAISMAMNSSSGSAGPLTINASSIQISTPAKSFILESHVHVGVRAGPDNTGAPQ